MTRYTWPSKGQEWGRRRQSGGRNAEFSEGGASGAGMARCRGCGRGKLVAPSSLGSCRTCCTPLHFRAAGEGDRAASLLPLPQLPIRLGGSNDSAHGAEGSSQKPEQVRRPGLRGRRGMETRSSGSSGKKEPGVRESSSQEEQRTQTPDLPREGHWKPRSLGPRVRRHGRYSLHWGRSRVYWAPGSRRQEPELLSP